MKSVRSTIMVFGVDTPVVIACLVGAIFLFLTLVPGTASAQSGNVYREIGAQSRQDVQMGVVVGIRQVEVQPSQFAGNAGALVGGGLGAALAAKMARNAGPSGRAALALLGGTLGGFGGQAVAQRVGAERATEIQVQMNPNGYNQGQVIAVVQPNPAPNVGMGQQVLVLNERGQNRVIPAQMPIQAQAAPQPWGQQRQPSYESQDRGYQQQQGYQAPWGARPVNVGYEN